MNESDSVKLLQDIRKILSIICLTNISGLKKQFLETDKDERIYDLCTRKTATEIAHEMPDLGHAGVYDKVSLWEKNGLLITEKEIGGRGRPKKYYIKVEMFLQ